MSPSLLPLMCALGCVPEYRYIDVVAPINPEPVEQAKPPKAEACPPMFGAMPPPGHSETSAILEIIGHCAEGHLQLGIDAVDVDPTLVEAVVFLVDLSRPELPGEQWSLDPSTSGIPAVWPGECMNIGYWSHFAPVDADSSAAWGLASSRFRCEDLQEGSSVTYAYALLHTDGEVVDCATAGADPAGLRTRAAQGQVPDFPLDSCHDGHFGLEWARKPSD